MGLLASCTVLYERGRGVVKGNLEFFRGWGLEDFVPLDEGGV